MDTRAVDADATTKTTGSSNTKVNSVTRSGRGSGSSSNPQEPDRYEWKTHSDHDYDWKQHSDHGGGSAGGGSAKMPPRRITLNDVKKKPPPKKNTPSSKKSQPPRPYGERSKEEQKLLQHQAAALLVWLESQGLKKSAQKLRLGLEKDLEDVKLPSKGDIKGSWKFVKAKDYDTSSSEEESSSQEESASSSSEEESSSSEDDGHAKPKTSSKTKSKSKSGKKSVGSASTSSYEEDMTSSSSEDDDNDAKPKAKKKKTPSRSSSFDGTSHRVPKRGVRRTVSFDENLPTVHDIPSRPEGEDKKLLYYSKAEIKEMRENEAFIKQEIAAENMRQAMEEAKAAFGVNF